MYPGPGICGVGDTGFMPKIDDPNFFPGGDGEHFIQVISNQREDLADSQFLQGFDKKFSTRRHTRAWYCMRFGMLRAYVFFVCLEVKAQDSQGRTSITPPL